MSLISEQIPSRGFEIVRDAIGAVLKTELDAQRKLQDLTNDNNIFIGRNTPFNQSEKLMINVMLDSAGYGSFNEASSHGSTTYFIDVYVSAKTSTDKDGGYSASQIRDKYMGMITYILQHHKYVTLGLPVGSIMGTYVEGFENFEASNNQDATYSKMGRVTFSVRINESQTLWNGLELNSIFTDIKLELTEKGYKLETQN